MAGVSSGDEVWVSSMTFAGGFPNDTLKLFHAFSICHYQLDIPFFLEEQLIVAAKITVA